MPRSQLVSVSGHATRPSADAAAFEAIAEQRSIETGAYGHVVDVPALVAGGAVGAQAPSEADGAGVGAEIHHGTDEGL